MAEEVIDNKLLDKMQNTTKMQAEGGPTHWLIHTGDNKNFENSISFKRWGYDSAHKKTFGASVKAGDILWFVRKGKILFMVTFVSKNKREVGPLIALTPTNEELGWTSGGPHWDMEIHYKDLYDLREADIDAGIRGQSALRVYDPTKCTTDLHAEYKAIVKYNKCVFMG